MPVLYFLDTFHQRNLKIRFYKILSKYRFPFPGHLHISPLMTRSHIPSNTVKSKMSAKRVGNSIFKFLRDKLRLPINREKSGIRKPLSFQVLGFGFVPPYKKGEKGKYQLVVKPSKWKEFKAKLKYLTKKTIPASFEERVDRINLLIRGRINYFRPASIQAKLKKLEEWLRNRLRYCIWHHWKKPERKRKNLIRLGIDQDHAYAWSRTRMGGWAVAQSPILRTTITIKRLKRKGYVSLIEYYKR